MKLNDIINAETVLNNIETLFLDFEQFPQTSILYAVLMELRTLNQKLRRYFQLKNINGLVNELIIAVSAAIEREIILEVQDIDLFLHIVDLILNCCNMNYNNISEISNITNEISSEYINNIKNITKSIQLIKKTQYLKNELLKEYESEKNKPIPQTVDKNDDKIGDNNNNEDNRNEDKNDNIVKKNVELIELSELVSLFNKTIDIANENATVLTDREKYDITNIASYIKNNANSIELNELDASIKQIDIIDDYISSLKKFSDSKITNNIKEIELNKYIEYDEIESLLKKSISLNEILNYNEYLINNIKKISKYLKNKNITLYLQEIKSIFNDLEHTINDKLLNAATYSTAIYNQLSKIRCKPFSKFTLGLTDYINIITELVGKNVSLEIVNNDVDITADLWKIINNTLPTIIRSIVLFNFPNDTNNFISIEAKSEYGIFELKISDNGKRTDMKKQNKMLRDTFLMCKDAGGRVFLSSNENGNKIKIQFQLENVLGNYVILEINRQYYAISAEYYAALDTETSKNIIPISLYSLFGIENRLDDAEMEFVVIRCLSKTAKILVDKIIRVAMLTPQRLAGNLPDTKYFIGAAQFGDKSVLILDIEAIINSIKK